jgi:hypothetical protein
MEISVELVVTVLAALGTGAIGPKIYDRIVSQRDGRQARERAGWIAADRAERETRDWEVWAHRVQLIAIQRGFEQFLPPFPNSSTSKEESNDH